jgi:hypothetical protein
VLLCWNAGKSWVSSNLGELQGRACTERAQSWDCTQPSLSPGCCLPGDGTYTGQLLGGIGTLSSRLRTLPGFAGAWQILDPHLQARQQRPVSNITRTWLSDLHQKNRCLGHPSSLACWIRLQAGGLSMQAVAQHRSIPRSQIQRGKPASKPLRRKLSQFFSPAALFFWPPGFGWCFLT